MSKRKWLSNDQVHALNERHGWFKHGDAQSDVSRAFANDAVEAYERLRASAPDLLENLIGCMEALSSHEPDCIEVECARAAITKAIGN